MLLHGIGFQTNVFHDFRQNVDGLLPKLNADRRQLSSLDGNVGQFRQRRYNVSGSCKQKPSYNGSSFVGGMTGHIQHLVDNFLQHRFEVLQFAYQQFDGRRRIWDGVKHRIGKNGILVQFVLYVRIGPHTFCHGMQHRMQRRLVCFGKRWRWWWWKRRRGCRCCAMCRHAKQM